MRFRFHVEQATKKKSVDISVEELKQIEPGLMKLHQLQKSLKNEFPRANISGSKDDLVKRLTVMRNNIKNKPAFAFEYANSNIKSTTSQYVSDL